MKRVYLVFSVLVFAAILITGCYRDVISPGADPNGPPQFVSFSGDLVPLFTKNCASSGCHDAVPAHKPSLMPDKAFNSLINGGYINTLVPHESGVYVIVKGGQMPPSGPLKPAEVQKLLDWIRNGAPNN
jgi:hypothetical protein